MGNYEIIPFARLRDDAISDYLIRPMMNEQIDNEKLLLYSETARKINETLHLMLSLPKNYLIGQQVIMESVKDANKLLVLGEELKNQIEETLLQLEPLVKC